MKRFKWYLALVLAGVLLVMVAGGCGSSDDSVKPPASYTSISIPIEELQNQPNIEAAMNDVVGGELTVTLGSNPTTGYRWSETAEISDESIIKQVTHEFQAQENTEIVGAAGQEVWTFEALKKGTATTIFRYSRSSEEALWTVTITTTVD